ncbi:MAG: Efflux transporter, RND family, MFP subunit [candidate division WWE3 bacterium GW2011_GWD1_42_70]|nr:MAG: Efflux transporter, RND family, MFP subunit [candidate division WWE3 bacterium GW2011_GWD1_42_70]
MKEKIKGKINKKSILVVLGLMVVGGLFFLTKIKGTDSENYYTVEKKDIDLVIESRGFVQSDENAELYFKIIDRITEVYVDEGDWVRKGDPLVALSSYSTNLDIKYAKDTRDVALLEKDLFVEKYQNDVDEVGGNDEYQIQLRTYDEKASKAESQYQKALINTSDTVLTAPFDGNVSKVMVEKGELSSLTRPAIEIQNIGILSVYANVSEVDIEYVNIDDKVEVMFDAFPDKKYIGKVTKINPAAQIVQGIAYYRVTVVPEAVPETLKVGMNADIDIQAESKKDVVTLPLYIINDLRVDTGEITLATNEGTKNVRVKLGVTGLEPAAFRTPCERASQLRHTPMPTSQNLPLFRLKIQPFCLRQSLVLKKKRRQKLF